MNRVSLYWLVLIFQLILISSAANAERRLTIASDQWCPFVCADPELPGIAIEVAQHIFGKLGITVDYILMDWDKAIEEVTKGNYDAVTGALPSESDQLIFSKFNFSTSVGCIYYNASFD